jgi:hypothetical protein
MMRAHRVALALLTLIPASLAAQEPEPEFAKHLFPPELVMQHQQSIRLTAEQRTSITQTSSSRWSSCSGRCRTRHRS